MMQYTHKPFQSQNNLFSVLEREGRLFWSFTQRDLLVTVISASIFMLVAGLSEATDTFSVFFFGTGMLYFVLYIYPFNILNQIYGLKEDILDKPDRPLPGRMLSIEEAWYRYAILTGIYLLLGVLLGVFWWTVLWVAVTYQLNARGWDKQWFTKNFVAMGLGTFAQLGPAWCIMGELTVEAFVWLTALSFWVGITSSTQDFRDQEGDKLTKRMTLPLLLGDREARKFMVVIWCAMSILIPVLFMLLAGDDLMTLPMLVLAVIMFVWHLFVAWRLYTFRTAKADRLTYNFHCILYCVLLLDSFLIL